MFGEHSFPGGANVFSKPFMNTCTRITKHTHDMKGAVADIPYLPSHTIEKMILTSFAPFL
jgi:hypothetical protein